MSNVGDSTPIDTGVKTSSYDGILTSHFNYSHVLLILQNVLNEQRSTPALSLN